MNKRVFILVILCFLLYDLEAQDRKRQSEWLLIYYMPLDNNIHHYGITAINQLQESLKTDDIIITVQADFDDNNGMRRMFLTDKSMVDFQIAEEQSGSHVQFSNYLNWISKHFNPEKYAFIFLDQGIDANYAFKDSKPYTNQVRLDTLSSIIEDFNETMDGTPELLFFQSENKYALEHLFEFRQCSDYLLFSKDIHLSQVRYYKELLYNLSQGNISTGEDLAYRIAKSDFNTSYSCINQSKWDGFLTILNESIDVLSKSGSTISYSINYKQFQWELSQIFQQLPAENNNTLKKYIADSLLSFYSSTGNSPEIIPGDFTTLLPSIWNSDEYEWLSINKQLNPVLKKIFREEPAFVKD